MGLPQITNFPSGFALGVNVLGMPILNQYGGSVWWVDSVNGSDGNKGTQRMPFATLTQAISMAVAGDLIMLKAGHAETLASAGAIAITSTQTGLKIIGLGEGSNRPTFTWSTLTTATWTIAGANVTISNIIGVCNINSLVSAFVVSAAGVTLDIEWQDSASNKEAIACILTTAAADKLKVNLRYMGQTGGSVCATPVKLVGCDEGIINVDFNGKASTAVVNFATTASTGIRVSGSMYNSGTTDSSKNVVDTIGGSLWWADIFDGAAGGYVRGGSGQAITGAAGNVGGWYLARKVIAAAGTSLTTGASPVTLFTVTGDVVARVFATVQTALASTLNNGTLAIGVSGNTGGFIAATTADGTNFPTGAVWAGDTSPTVKSEVFTASALNGNPVAGSANITCTIATNSMTSGAITFYCLWLPISAGASVIAA